MGTNTNVMVPFLMGLEHSFQSGITICLCPFVLSFFECSKNTFFPAYFLMYLKDILIFPGGSEGKASACNAGDAGLIPGLGRSPGEGNGNPLQYCCLENPMVGEAWWAIVHAVAKSRTRLSGVTHSLTQRIQ